MMLNIFSCTYLSFVYYRWRNDYSDPLTMFGSSYLSFVLVCLACHNKIPQNGWLKQQKLISHSSGGWESKIEVLALWVPGEDLDLLGLWTASFSLCPYMAETASSGVSSSSYKDTSLMTSSKLNYLQRSSPPNSITLSVRTSICEFAVGVGHTHPVYNSLLYRV